MALVALSINHTKTPVAIREKVAFSQSDISRATSELLSNDSIAGSAILSTCNRLEMYISTSASNASNAQDQLTEFLAQYHHLSADTLRNYIECYEGADAIHHLCQVASGLHSLVVGEPQILGQLKDSYNIAKDMDALGSELDHVFQHAFSVAKKIRTTTDIGKNPVSVAFLGVKLSQKIFADLSHHTALLIGSGEMIELSAKHLAAKHIKHIIIANRTPKNAEKILAELSDVSVEIISIKQLCEYFHQGDIVISSTAAEVAIIGKGLVESSIKKRKRKPMFILDIAIPRDVEAQVAELDDVFLYTVDDLKQVIQENEQNRAETKELALAKINELNAAYINELAHQEHKELIKHYHQHAQIVKTELITQALKDLESKNPNEVLTKLADQLTNKLIHNNLQNIKSLDIKQIDQCQGCIPEHIDITVQTN